MSSSEDDGPVPERDMEVEEVENDNEVVEVTGLGSTPPKELNDVYTHCTVRTDLSLIGEPAHPTRGIHEDRIGDLKTKFEQKGFLPSVGLISVAVRGARGYPRNSIDNGVLKVRSEVADGRHRRRGLMEADKSKGQLEQTCKRLPVTLRYRKDGAAITALDILSVGALLNEQASTVSKPIFVDWLYASVSTVKVLMESGGVTDVSDLAESMYEKGTLGRKSIYHIIRYAQIAMKLSGEGEEVEKEVLKTCKECKRLALVHLGATPLLGLDTESFLFGIEVVKYYVESEARGTFEKIRHSFFKSFMKLLELVSAFMKTKNLTMPEVLGKRIADTDSEITIRDTICKQMMRFKLAADERRQELADTSRCRNSTKRLSLALGPLDDQGRREGGEGGVESVEQKGDVEVVHVQNVEDAAVEIASQAINRAVSSRRKRKRSQTSGSGGGGAGGGEMNTVKRRKTGREKDTRRSIRKTGREKDTRRSIRKELQRMGPERVGKIVESLGMDVVVLEEDEEEEGEETDYFPVDDNAKFDDTLPSDLPHGTTDPSPHEGDERSAYKFCRYAAMLPSRWAAPGGAGMIEHACPWFSTLHIPFEHRGNIFFQDTSVLLRNHHAVYWRGAHNMLKRRSNEELDAIMVGNVPNNREQLLMGAIELESDTALSYFGEKKQELAQVGFCVVENFLADHRLPEGVVGEGKETFRKLWEFVMESLPGEELLKKPEQRTAWNLILNRDSSDNYKEGKQGRGRFSSTNLGVVQLVEKDAEKVWVARARAFLDMRIAQVMVAIQGGNRIGEGGNKMHIP